MEIQTIRESIDAYKRRIAEVGFSPNKCINDQNYPHDNHEFAMQANPDEIRKIFEGSGQFKLYCDKPSPLVAYSMICIPTKHLVIGGREDLRQMGYPPLLDKSWTGFTIHEHGARIENNYAGVIRCLEIILSIAEKHRVPMTTEHKEDWERHFVNYFPEQN